MPCRDTCSILASAERALRAAARGANDLAAAADRRMRREAERCGACGKSALGLIAAMAGLPPSPSEPRLEPERNLREFIFSSLNRWNAGADTDSVFFLSDEMLRRALSLRQPCVTYEEESAAAFAMIHKIEKESGGLAVGRPYRLHRIAGLGDFVIDRIAVGEAGAAWLLYADWEEAHFAREIESAKDLIRAAGRVVLGLNAKFRWEGYSAPRPPASQRATKAKTRWRR